MDLEFIDCFVFDFGMTLSSHPYFYVCPPHCPKWFELFQQHVFSGDPPIFDRWMAGAICAEDVAQRMAPIMKMPIPDVLEYMKKGLLNLSLNDAVNRFADAVKRMGKHTVLVTGNIDLFDAIAVPDLGLESKFDVIVNSYWSRTLFKQSLWDEAFESLDDDVGYHNSFLVEDNLKNVQLFRDLGGPAHHYRDDKTLIAFLKGTA